MAVVEYLLRGEPMSWGEALLWGALIVAVLIAVLTYLLFQNFVFG